MTPEQAALLKKAHDSLWGAKLLAKDGLYDFAASRAYYTMFYVAEAMLLSTARHTEVSNIGAGLPRVIPAHAGIQGS
jgi:uncharacterized protein (UPF0332 family)